MNCQQCQRQVLLSQSCESLPPDLSAHLAECMVCRQWQKRLVQIESHVASLPVPPAERKRELLEALLADPARVPVPLDSPRRQHWRRPVYVGGGLLAASLLVACGILVGNWLARGFKKQGGGPGQVAVQKKPPSTPATLAGHLVQIDLRLATAQTPRARVETLAEIAHSLHGETRALAAVSEAKDLQTLANLYGKVLRDGIVVRARKLPVAERRQALDPIVAQLDTANREAEELARTTAPERAAPLLQMAAVSRTSNQQLRALLEEATP